MPISRVVDAGSLSSSLQLWVIVGPLVDVIAGGVLGGLFQLLLSKQRFEFTNA